MSMFRQYGTSPTSALSVSPQTKSVLDHQNRELTPEEEYWQANLRDVSIPQLPVLHTEINAPITQTSTSTLTLSAETIQAISKHAKDISVASLLLSSIYALLYRHTNDGNITTRVANNEDEPLPLRVTFDHTTDFLELAERLQISQNEVEKNKLSFDSLCSVFSSNVQAILNATTNIFVFINKPNEAAANITTKFLTIRLNTLADGKWEIEWTYNHNFFSPLQVAEMMAHLDKILLSAKDDPSCPLSEIPMLLPEEIEKVNKLNQTQCAQQFGEKLFHDVFVDLANTKEVGALPFLAYYPPTPAPRPGVVIDPDYMTPPETMTYQECNIHTNKIANYLRSVCQIKPGDVIAVLLPRSLHVTNFCIGILKAGGVWMPLDPFEDKSSDKAALKRKFASANVRLLIGDEITLKLLPDRNCDTININNNEITSSINEFNSDYHEVALTLKSPAYISNTTGSSSTSKMVEVSHRGLRNLLTVNAKMNYLPQSRVLSFALAIHDPFINDITIAVATHGSTHILSDVERISPFPNQRLIAKGGQDQNGLTFAALPPSIMKLISPGSNLREVHSMGSAPFASLIKEWMKANPNLRIWNGYGPTEGTVVSTLHLFRNDSDMFIIGKGVANTRLYVLHPKTYSHCSRGVIGEIFIGGDGVLDSRYVNNRTLTEEKFRWMKYDSKQQRFLPSAKHEAGAERLYATADHGCYTEDTDGDYVIKHIGRTDRRVKLCNNWVDLDEVEADIRKHPDIDNVAVILSEDGTRLAAFFTMKKTAKRCSEADAAHSLRHHMLSIKSCTTSMPQFELLRKIELTDNGKVNYKKLPVPTPEKPIVFNPNDDLGGKLTTIWKSLLLDPTRTFQDGGGSSLVLAQLELIINDSGHFRLFRKVGPGSGELGPDMTLGGLITTLTPLSKF
jgi:non-ribosomal peptide synthetase component F